LAGLTYNKLIEFDEKVTIPSLSMNLLNSLYSIKWTNKSINNLKITSVIKVMFQLNDNQANASDTLIPNSRTFDNGIYSSFQYSYKLWNFQAGARYDIRNINTMHSFSGLDPINRNFGGFNTSIGSVYGGKKVTFRTSLSTGYRAPHLTELVSNGFHHGALRFEIGDQNLVPEYASQVDVSSEISQEHFVVVLNPFINRIRNFIYLQPVDSLVDWNLQCLQWICDSVRIKYPDIKPSQVQSSREIRTDIELNPRPSDFQSDVFQPFSAYTQVFQEKNGFLPNLSMLDFVLSAGPNFVKQWIENGID
jgi:hypothetical protein